MFSGWGIRTMARVKAGTIPSNITTGPSGRMTTALLPQGSPATGSAKEAADVIAGIFEASWFFHHRLPEVFAGYERTKTRYPRAVHHSLHPPGLGRSIADAWHPHLAWPGTQGRGLTSVEDAILPRWMGTLTVDGIPGRWGRAKVVAKGDDTAMLSTKEIYESILSAREELGKMELAA